MARVKQASKRKRTNKAATAKMLGAAGLGLSLIGGASATPTRDIPQTDNTSPNQRFVLGEEEMADVSLATFHLFDRENVGSAIQLARGCGCGGCHGCGGGGGCHGCGHGCGGGGFVGCRGCGGGCGCRGCGGGGCGGCGLGAWFVLCAGCVACTGCAGCCLSWGACRLC